MITIEAMLGMIFWSIVGTQHLEPALELIQIYIHILNGKTEG